VKFMREAWVLIVVFLASLGAMFAGVTLLPDALSSLDYRRTLDVDVDFPPTMNATVLALWHRPTLRRESCGEYCEVDVCYDDWIAEFGWQQTPGAPAQGFYKVSGNQLQSRDDSSCHGGPCNMYSDWRSLPIAQPPSTPYNAVSEAWSVYRCDSDCEGQNCGERFWSCPRINSNHNGRARTSCADLDWTVVQHNETAHSEWTHGTWQHTESGTARRAAVSVGQVFVARVPPDPAYVPSLYRCPTPVYNANCVRLGDQPYVELQHALEGANRDMIVGAVLLGAGGGCACLFGLWVVWCYARAKARA